MTCENDNSTNRQDELHEQADADADDRLCKCVCSKEDFADDEEFRRHINEKHLKSFKIILSRLDLKSFNRIPNKENAFKLTKFDRNVISDDVQNTYKLSDFFIEIKRLKLRNDCRYKIVETRPQSSEHVVWDDMNLVPEAVYSGGVEPAEGDKNMAKKRGPVSAVNTLYVKRKIESLLGTAAPVKPKPETKATPNRITVGSSAAAAAYLFNNGKQKRLMSRGRRNAARKSARKHSVDSSEFDSSSSDEDLTYEERRPLSSYQNTAPASNSFNDHFMSGLAKFPQLPKATTRHDHAYCYSSARCSITSRRTTTTARKTINSAPGSRQTAYRGRGNSFSSPYSVVNQQTVTTSQSHAAFGTFQVGPTGSLKATSATSAFNAKFKVIRRVTTFHAESETRKKPIAQSRPTSQNVVTTPAPQAVISLLSDSDESAVEIVESEPSTLDNEDNDVYILPS